MIAPKVECDESKLKRLLDGDASAMESVSCHLEMCVSCQNQLHRLAAEKGFWSETTKFLRSDSAYVMASDPQIASLETDSVADPEALLETDDDGPSNQGGFAFLAPSDNAAMLGRLGRYEIERVLGCGGMGIVMKGIDGELNRTVAIKVLAPHLASNGSARRRFAREARAAAAVAHNHVIPIHNVETEGPTPYLVMHYVAGQSLQERVDQDGPLDIQDALRVGMQTADGLAAAHRQGLVHRDVKPGNILFK